jgi:hypothetical protein
MRDLYRLMLSLGDADFLKFNSTSPLVEGPDFVPEFRAVFKLLLGGWGRGACSRQGLGYWYRGCVVRPHERTLAGLRVRCIGVADR